MSQVTELLLKIRQQGGEQLIKLQNSLKNLKQQSTATNVNFKQFSNELKEIQQTSVKSVNNLRGYATAWREIANSVKIGSAEFKKASAEAAKLERQVLRIESRRSLKGIAQTVGTVAGAGVFGGPEAAISAAFGGIVAGVPGAITAGAIGAQVGQLRQLAGATATYAAEISRQRQALQLVTKDAGEYQRALAFISRTSTELAIPQELITRQFTQLTASVKGAGGNVRDAEKAFIGIASGIRGTGGSLEQLDSALLATSQVFSKGKVSAEELRQQIGERLPGAFSLFAQSMGKTPQELDKALEKGQVSLQDFQNFVEELLKRYGENAKIIADGPDAAGDRLKTSLANLSESVGTLLKPIGASFQNAFAKIVAWIDRATRKLNEFLKANQGSQISRLQQDVIEQTARINKLEDMGAKRAQQGSYLQEQYAQALNKRARAERELLQLQKPGLPQTATAEPVSALPGITADPTKTKIRSNRDAERAEALAARLLERRNEITRRADQLQRELNEKIIETSENINSLGANALQVFERQYIDKVSDAQKVTGDLLLKIFKLAKEYREAGGKLDITGLVRGVMDLEEAAVSLAQGEYAQNLNKFLTGLDEKFAAITERVYENAKAMQYNADIMGGLQDGFRSYADSLGTTREAFTNLAENGMKTVEQAIFDLATTGTTNYAEFASAILRQTAQMIIQQFVLKSIMTALGFVGGGTSAAIAPLENVPLYNASGVRFDPAASTYALGFAMGGIMTDKGPLALKKYAAGGIARGPQMALFGEGSRPEAYVPLPDGRSIPVTMNGGGETVINVSVDAKGTNVQGNESQSRQLGVAISAAVQQELIKQRRPGGLLAG